ncbi:MAG: TIGR03067 domain-containing protein [Planctomycetes bacterium]|nr:TIGR03067 domain-containing protein [Planctomycetota bacterium]
MRLLPFLALASFTCLAAAQPEDEAVKKELKRFQGKWEAVASQGFDGKSPTDVELSLTSLVIEGNKFTLKTGSITVDLYFKIDPTKKIKTIDVYGKDAPDKVLLRGIYEIKGDTRKSCFSEAGKARPDRFRKEKGFMTLEWKRAQ